MILTLWDVGRAYRIGTRQFGTHTHDEIWFLSFLLFAELEPESKIKYFDLTCFLNFGLIGIISQNGYILESHEWFNCFLGMWR